MTLYARLDEFGNRVELKEFAPGNEPDPFIAHKGILWVRFTEVSEKLSNPDRQVYGERVDILTEEGLQSVQTVRDKTVEELQEEADRKAQHEAAEARERKIDGYEARIADLERRMAIVENAKPGVGRA